MESNNSFDPFLPFGSVEDREYGSIMLFNPSEKIMDGLPFLYSRFRVAPRSTSRLDQHEVREIWVIMSGKGTLSFDGREFSVKPRDIVHFNSMRAHQVTNEGTEDMEIFSLWWKRG